MRIRIYRTRKGYFGKELGRGGGLAFGRVFGFDFGPTFGILDCYVQDLRLRFVLGTDHRR